MGNPSLVPVRLVKTDGQTMIPSYIESWMNWRRFYERDGIPLIKLAELLDGEPINRDAFAKKMALRMGKPNGACPICNGRGTTNLSDYGSNTNWCLCEMIDWFLKYKKLNEKLESSWNEKYLATFKISPQREGSKKLVFMKEQTQRFIANPTDKWLIMQGGTGAGKSFMIEAIRSDLGSIALYIACQDIGSVIHSSMKDYSTDSVMGILRNAPVLLLDDYGAQYAGSPFTQSVLNEVIDYRYRDSTQRPTVIATNLDQTDLKRLDSRTASRMLDQRNSMLVEVQGVSDYRSIRA